MKYEIKNLNGNRHAALEGKLSETSGPHGSGKTRELLELLKEKQLSHTELHMAWIEESFNLNPVAIAQHGMPIEQTLFIEAGEDFAWTALQCIRSGIFSTVVLCPVLPLREIDLRRIQIASKQNHTTTLMIQEFAHLNGGWVFHERRSVG